MTYIILCIIMLTIGFCSWYAYIKWDLIRQIWRLKNELDSVIARYNTDINDVKDLNDNLRSVNSKLKADIANFKSQLIELKVKSRDVAKKINNTDNDKHEPKKKWRSAKK